MCHFYAHTFQCKHQSLTFAKFCRAAGLIQTPCATGHTWASIDVDGPCEECWVCFPDRVYATPQRIRKAKAAALRGGFARRV